jgi:hypothetical protein
MNCDEKQADGKKQYEPPQLMMISLRPDEAVLGHCKSMGSGSFQPGNCAAILGACASIGS